MGRALRRWTRRRKPVFLLAAVTALLVTASGSPSARASEQSVAARAEPGNLILSPKPDALVKHAQARAAFRVPAGTNRLWVRLNDRNITSRFGGGGGRRVASLSLGSGLRYGSNTLYILAKRGDRKPRVDAHSFTFGRRVPGLAQLKMDPGPVTSVGIRVAAPTLTPAVFDSRREFKRRLNVIRRDRLVRIRLNGRPVTKAFTSPQPTRWNTMLSATHGLRHGVNRLRVLIAEPETGRYELLQRRFVLPQGVPLPAAGPDLARPLGLDRMPLDARSSRDGDGGGLSYTWKILSKPRGSNPKLRGADTARPLFDPDRRGRYRVGLHAADPSDPLASSEAIDLVDLVVPPSQMLVPFGYVPTGGVGTQGIKVGEKAYGASCGLGIQWLTLDRVTLKPSKTGNALIDPHGSCGGGVGLDTVEKAVAKGGNGDLVILTHAPRFEAPLKPGQADQFNSILKLLGVGPLDSLTRPFQQLVVVGVPYGGDGSGYSSQVFNPADDRLPGQPALTGWLMPDSVQAGPRTPRFRFQPEKIEFDTSVGNPTDLDSQMNLGGELVHGPPLPDQASGGFQVVAIDPITFKPVAGRNNQTYGTNYPPSADPQTASINASVDRREMTEDLTSMAQRKLLVAVQSIGHVKMATLASNQAPRELLDRQWRLMTEAMQANGANPHTFFTLGCDMSDYSRPACSEADQARVGAGGSYAFLGGSVLDRSEMVESSSSVLIDPTRDPPLAEGGTLQGFASIRSDGFMRPAIADGSDRLQFEMYDFVFREPTPWPLTKEAGHAEADQYKKALAYITTCVNAFKGWGPDLRSIYAGNLDLGYGTALVQLDTQPYPADIQDHSTCPDWNFNRDPGFTRLQWGTLLFELNVEIGWLASVKTLFESAEQAIGRSGTAQLVDLKTLGEKIKNTIKPPSDATAKIFEDIGEFFLLVFEDLALIPTSAASLGFVEAVAAVYQISTSLASDAGGGGKPLSAKIDETVDDLSGEVAARLGATAAGLDRIRQVINSDYGRLRALASVAGTPAYSPDTSTMADRMTQAANQWFASALLPVAFGVHALHESGAKGKATVENCYITRPSGWNFSKAPPTAWVDFFGDFHVDRFAADFPTVFVLALHDLTDSPDKVPDKSIADTIFRTPAQFGYGLQLHRFMWEQYEDARPGAPPTNIAECI